MRNQKEEFCVIVWRRLLLSSELIDRKNPYSWLLILVFIGFNCICTSSCQSFLRHAKDYSMETAFSVGTSYTCTSCYNISYLNPICWFWGWCSTYGGMVGSSSILLKSEVCSSAAETYLTFPLDLPSCQIKK